METRVSTRKNSKMFYLLAFFSIFDEKFIEVLYCACNQAWFFLQRLHLKCLTVFWIHLSRQLLSNLYGDLMLCTASQTFRILACSEFRIIQAYSALLRDIDAHWDIVKSHSGLFSTICNPRIFTTLPHSKTWFI